MQRSHALADSPHLLEGDTFPLDARMDEGGHDPHWHPTAQFVTAVIGGGVLTIDGRDLPFDAATGVWVPAGVEHAGCFSPDLVPLVVELVVGCPEVAARAVPVDDALRLALLRWARDADPAQEDVRQRMLADAIERATVTRVGLVLPAGPFTAPVREHLRQTPAHVPPLEDWARRLHTSVATIRRAFLAETGRPYSEWTALYRLELSLDRLLAGEPVGAVARAVGFSPNGYSLAFRRWTGLTPSEFRARSTGR